MTRARPNILFITADQWRGDCLGLAGHGAALDVAIPDETLADLRLVCEGARHFTGIPIW